MPRRRSVNLQRNIGVDPKYGSSLIQKLINIVMERGKKSTARAIVYDAMDVLVKKAGDQGKGLALFHKAFDNIIPAIEVRPRRVGGSVYQIPRPVEGNRGRALAMRWLINASSARSGKTMGERLAHELMDAVQDRGGAIKKKVDMHRMAESNRAFSHFSW
ncbi:30S ribosomal protein S7 [Candidatus Babeliales bacterium]|nr:30S ribosomal protein S7 [Candidatus Babeliales bacterium]